jgi:hypothetical protein
MMLFQITCVVRVNPSRPFKAQPAHGQDGWRKGEQAARPIGL